MSKFAEAGPRNWFRLVPGGRVDEIPQLAVVNWSTHRGEIDAAGRPEYSAQVEAEWKLVDSGSDEHLRNEKV